ncbi:V-type ATP synthase subunit I [Clostridium sp.]|uniref:V-type ATP synthase subunit I n=1 Tax=Clostridium sp. TaxID=1506 RepID=UPI003F318E25
MAIVKMNKFTLLTFESKKKELLRKLQGIAEVEFINLQDEEMLEKYEVLQGLSKDDLDSDYVKCEENLSKTKSALDFLQKYTPKKSMIQELKEEKKALSIEELETSALTSNWEEVVSLLKEKEKEITGLEGQITKLNGEIDLLTPWEALDAPFESLKELKTISFFLGSISKQYEEELLSTLTDGFVEIVSRTANDINLLVVVHKEKEDEVSELLRGFGFSSFKTEHKDAPMKLVTDFKSEIEELKSKIFFVKEELAAYEEYENTLKLVFECFSNEMLRKKSVKNFLNISSVVAIQGWTPVESNEKLTSVCKDVLGEDYYVEFEEVKEDEVMNVPIKLRNGALASSFESVTAMFAYPKYDEIDPTPLLTPFYLIFFGMMVADIGYGLLMALTTLLALKLFKLDDEKKKMVKFGFYLSIPTIFFGIIYNSFFGGIIKLPFTIIDTERDINTIMILSLVFGVIQIFTGLVIKAVMLIKTGRGKDAFLDVGSWVIALVSIGIFGYASLGDTASPLKMVGIVGMVIGAILIVYAGGREEKSNGAKIGQGLYSLYGITNYVSDLVSYTRLMALGLAGGSIAAAINMIISMIPGWSAIIVVPLLFLLAHLFNLGLGLLGAYVHTARLQYIEYFGKFYEGGGRQFMPFKATEKYINIKK